MTQNTNNERSISAFAKLTYHIVFSTKYRRPLIQHSFRESLYEYFGGILRGVEGHLIEIGGVEDHVHLLAHLSPKAALSDSIRNIKAKTSKWCNSCGATPLVLSGKKAILAFTVSYSQIEKVQRYIQNQPEHHRTKSFEEEYTFFLQKHDIHFERKYLFEAEFHG